MPEPAREHRAGVREHSKARIAVHWREEERVAPPPELTDQANTRDEEILGHLREQHFPRCLERYAALLIWDRWWDAILDDSNPSVLECDSPTAGSAKRFASRRNPSMTPGRDADGPVGARGDRERRRAVGIEHR
jgi:hypothetical protein